MSPKPKPQPQWRVQYRNPKTNMLGIGFIYAGSVEEAKEQYGRENSVEVQTATVEKTLDNLHTY